PPAFGQCFDLKKRGVPCADAGMAYASCGFPGTGVKGPVAAVPCSSVPENRTVRFPFVSDFIRNTDGRTPANGWAIGTMAATKPGSFAEGLPLVTYNRQSLRGMYWRTSRLL